MTKKKLDLDLVDYLAQCARIEALTFCQSHFHIYTFVWLYKEHGEAFLKPFREKLK